MESAIQQITISKNGPYTVTGNVLLDKGIIVRDDEGVPVEWQNEGSIFHEETYKLCRCGHSKNKPFCDDTHLKIKFDGTETAENKKYKELAVTVPGPELILTDAKSYCAGAGFCGRAGGIRNLVKTSDNIEAKEIAIQEAADCPSGRLVVWDKTGAAIEPAFEPSITIAEIVAGNLSGPICVKGGIELVSDNGQHYEVRNRMALCRCGGSENKPFCDGSHISMGFYDGE